MAIVIPCPSGPRTAMAIIFHATLVLGLRWQTFFNASLVLGLGWQMCFNATLVLGLRWQ